MLHNIRPQWLSNIKHSNLLVRFVSYDENEELWIPAQESALSVKSIKVLCTCLTLKYRTSYQIKHSSLVSSMFATKKKSLIPVTSEGLPVNERATFERKPTKRKRKCRQTLRIQLVPKTLNLFRLWPIQFRENEAAAVPFQACHK
jgi:hypothetical protein